MYVSVVKITYNPVKRAAALAERELDFLDAEQVFAGDELTREDTRRDYPERRFQTIGFLGARMVMVVWTPNGEARHVISRRKCNAREQKKFGERLEIGKQLGKS